MKDMKTVIAAAIAGVCAIVCVTVAVGGFVNYKKSSFSQGISATGSANMDFTSDLIVWRGSYSAHGQTTKEAYAVIKKDAQLTRDYMLKNGVSEEELVFNSVVISPQIDYLYNDQGMVIGQTENGFNLSQEVAITSSDVDKIESISRDVTQLIDSGVEFASQAPEYYYTKLDELKLEMIEAATQNAKARIDILTEHSKSQRGKLLTCDLGVFQITAQNSDSDEYSYSGAFNTSAKEKTASVTVRLNYSVK